MEGSEDRARGTTIVFIINDKPYFCMPEEAASLKWSRTQTYRNGRTGQVDACMDPAISTETFTEPPVDDIVGPGLSASARKVCVTPTHTPHAQSQSKLAAAERRPTQGRRPMHREPACTELTDGLPSPGGKGRAITRTTSVGCREAALGDLTSSITNRETAPHSARSEKLILRHHHVRSESRHR